VTVRRPEGASPLVRALVASRHTSSRPAQTLSDQHRLSHAFVPYVRCGRGYRGRVRAPDRWGPFLARPGPRARWGNGRQRLLVHSGTTRRWDRSSTLPRGSRCDAHASSRASRWAYAYGPPQPCILDICLPHRGALGSLGSSTLGRSCALRVTPQHGLGIMPSLAALLPRDGRAAAPTVPRLGVPQPRERGPASAHSAGHGRLRARVGLAPSLSAHRHSRWLAWLTR
jgi:hypothetical protein